MALDFNRNLRENVIAELGGKCSQCGWLEAPELLLVWPKEGIKDSRRKTNYDRYWMTVLGALDSYRLVCPNHNSMLMAARRDASKQAQKFLKAGRGLAIGVWLSPLDKNQSLLGMWPWLAKKESEGLQTILVILEGHPEVYARGTTEQFAPDWATALTLLGLPACDRPVKPWTLLEPPQ